MPTLDEILQSALGSPLPQAADTGATLPTLNQTIATGLPDPKQLSVTTVSDAKKSSLYQISAGIGNQAGAATMGELETDLRTMDPLDLVLKYGPDAQRLLSARTTAGRDFRDDQAINTRTPSMAAADTVSGIGGGLANAFGGLGSLAAGLISDEAGIWGATKLNEMNQWIEGTQSDTLNARRRTVRAESALDKRDSDAQYELDKKSVGNVLAGARRIGRDVVDAVANNASDQITLIQGASDAAGSLLAGGPIAKTIGAAGAPLAQVGRAAGISEAALARAAVAGERLTMPATIGAIEGGGAYQSTATEVMQQSFEDLEKNSPAFRELVASGSTPEAARIELANRSALLAAAIQAPVGAATGALVSRFERSPFQVPSLGSAATNVALREPIEEAIQSGAGQVAQNLAIRETVNPNKDLTEGVGEQIGTGALFGFGSAALVQAPGAAGRALQAGAELTARGLRNVAGSILERGQRVIDANQKASPVADPAVLQESIVAQAEAPATAEVINQAIEATPATPEEKAVATSYVDGMMQKLNITPEELVSPDYSPELTAALGGVTNRVDAMQRLAEVMNSTEDGSQDQLDAGYRLLDLYRSVDDFLLQEAGALDQLPADSEANQLALKYERLVANLAKTPKVMNALNVINKLVTQTAEQGIQDITEESLSTPEGQQNVKNAVAVAQVHPDKGNLQANEQILYQASQGKLNLTPNEATALRASIALLQAKQTAAAQQSRLGLRPVDLVSNQIQTDKSDANTGKKSAAQYTNEILAAYRSGNRDLAAARLSDFGMFVQHMQNKVQALNTHLASGDPNSPAVTYQALNPTTREWYTSPDGLRVRPASANSIEFAQKVGVEAETLANVFNGLTDALTGLSDGAHISPISLDTRLDGPAQAVADEFRSRKRSVDTSPVATESTGVTQSVTKTVTTVAPEDEADLTAEAPERVKEVSKESEEIVKTPEPVEQAPEVQEVSAPEPITNKQWMKGDLREIRGDDGRARLIQGPTSITYDREGDLIKVNLISTKKEGRGQGSARQALNTLVELVDQAGLRMQLDVAEQDTATDKQRLMDFYSSVGFQQVADTDTMTRDVGGVVTPPTPEPVREGLDAVYPDLVGGESNYFKQAFRLPTEPKTHIAGSDAPLSFVDSILSSTQNFSRHLNGNLNRDYDTNVAMAYGDIMDIGSELKQLMNKNLNEYLSKPYSKNDPRTRGQLIAENAEVTTSRGTTFLGSNFVRTPEGKALNITDSVNGKLTYNDGLVESAVLAGLQWMINANQYGQNLDDQDIANYAGIPVERVTPYLREQLNLGMSLVEAKQTLATKIQSYWGVNTDRNTPEGYTRGIPESVAAEVLRAMEATPILEVVTVTVGEEFGLSQPKTINRYIITPINEENPITAFPDAIERAVMIEPEVINFIGEDAKPPVAQRQMNNPMVENTDEQKTAIANEQATKFYVNPNMINMYVSLGVENIQQLFGAGNDKTRILNERHASSVEGKNRTIAAGFHHLMAVVAEAENHGNHNNIPLDQVPIRYAYNVSRVGRMQMLGKYNPQSTKLVREAILPTRSTLDLSGANPSHMNAFMLAMAQHMGIKVHNLSLENSIAKVDAMLQGTLGPLVDLADSLNSGNHVLTGEEVSRLQEGFSKAGADLTPGSLHALSEYARFRADPNKSSFTTGLYLEADGKTNGPINAMGLFTLGKFTEHSLTNLGKGGVFFGPRKTANEHTEFEDSKDLYQATTDSLAIALGHQREMLRQDPYGTDQTNRLLSLMSTFLPDLNFDETQADAANGGLELKRGIAKNPLTITIYGSGAAGIAGNIVDTLAEKMYERMSDAATVQAQQPTVTLSEAMFGIGNPDADRLMDQLSDSFDELTQFVAKRQFDGSLKFVAGDEVKPRKGLDPVTFALTAPEYKNLQQNMLELFVAPLRQGIEYTVGSSLLNAVKGIRMATQVQSIFQQYAFRDMVAEAIAVKEQDPNYRPGDFLSQAELDGINKRLNELSPVIDTGSQRFYIAGSSRADIPSQEFGRALDGTMRTDGYVYGPNDAGVAGIPFLTIGMGDGMMMQSLATQSDITGTLKIFDGMNMPLDKIEPYSVAANKAVYDSWQGNPMSEVLKSFSHFAERATLDESAPEEMMTALQTAIFGFGKLEFKVTPKMIMDEIQGLGDKLKMAAANIDARHAVMNSTAMSFDQMAAAGAPYTNTGEALPQGATAEEIVSFLNQKYDQALAGEVITTAQVQADDTGIVENIQAEVPSDISQELSSVGRAHRSGARVLSYTALENLNRTITMTDSQKVIFGEIMRSMATKQYKVVYGTPEQIRDYQEQTGNIMPNQIGRGAVQGYTVISDQTVYLINPSVETLVHELIHAATFEKVHNVYQGLEANPEIIQSVERIEGLMDQFMQQTSADEHFTNVRGSITAAQVDPYLSEVESKAMALNEFMAWSLTNETISEQLKSQQVPRIVQMAKDVVAYIKRIIWGRKKAPAAGDDALSNLQFNTGVIIRSQPTVAAAYTNAVAYQNTWYGDDARLAQLKAAFNNKVAQYLKQPLRLKVTAPKVAVSEAIMSSIRLGKSAQVGFPMTMQESSTFRSILTALATEAEIDASAMAQVQELYQHFNKTVTLQDFMQDPQGNDPNDLYQAQQKMDVVMGNYLTETDAKGRSSLLPVFVALAMTNNTMRDVLAKMELPKRLKKEGRTIDNFLSNTGNAVMDKLTERLSGQGPKAKNVQNALDNLFLHIQEVAQDDQTFIDQYASKAGGILDRANSYIVDSMSRLSNATMTKAESVAQKTNSKTVRALANMTRLTAAMVTEQNADLVAQTTMAALNKANIWRPMHDIINDLVGRTENNSSIYDMIKTVRSMVQQDRQQFREHLPGVIADKFTRKLEANEWSALHAALGKTDLASLVQGRTANDVLKMIADPTALDSEVSLLETTIQNQVGGTWILYEKKMRQLANYMSTGAPGTNLLRNAYAISQLFGETLPRRWSPPTADVVKAMDQLISLYAVQSLPTETLDTVASLVQTEGDGIVFSLSYLVGQRAEEQRKASTDRAKVNQYKGYIPTMNQSGVQLIVADDTEYADLIARSYTRVADYVGSSADRLTTRKGYYFIPVSGRAVYNQGILQNVRHTTMGVDAVTGFTHDNMIAGRILESRAVRRAAMALQNEAATSEPLMPVYDEKGRTVAFERSIDPKQLTVLNPDTHFAKMVGVWRGRQVEEAKAQFFNEKLIDSLKAMYDKDIADSYDNARQYVNLYSMTKDPVIADAVSLFTPETQDYIKKTFGSEFFVRRDMLNDAIGYRNASVGDLWTGNTRWSDETVETVKKLALGVFGNKAYRYVVSGERLVQNFVGDAKTMIVVKSVVVPMSNLIANMYQLIGRGVPMLHLVRQMPKKTVEINSYVESQLRKIGLEADLRAAEGNLVKTRKLTAEIQSIDDAHRRLSIWPLLEAGEFTAISDVNLTPDDVELTSGKLNAYIERLVDKLPESIQTAGRYALVTKDTALYQGLAKSIQYGDFIAKSLLYDDLVKRQGRTPEYALGRVSEEFVNYDRLPGRFRGYIESLGLLWFWNFKIRSVKTAASMIRNNPLHTFLATVAPAPTMFGSVGLPVEDNLFAKLADGSLDYSVGLGQAFRAPLLNPWVNLVN